MHNPWVSPHAIRFAIFLFKTTYCVPDLELDVFLVDLNGASTEFHPDGQVMLLSEALVSELQQQAALTDTYTSLLSLLFHMLRIILFKARKPPFPLNLLSQWKGGDSGR